MAATVWGRAYLLVCALNLFWFLGVQFFLATYGLAYDVSDWTLISLLAAFPAAFVLGHAFVMGTGRLRALPLTALITATATLFVAAEFEQFSDSYQYASFAFDGDRLMLTGSGPLFALLFVAMSVFTTRSRKITLQTLATSPDPVDQQVAPSPDVPLTRWGGFWRHAVAFGLSVSLSNFANGFFGYALLESSGSPTNPNEVLKLAQLSALILCACQVVVYWLVYSAFRRIDPIKVLPLLVLVSLIGIWVTQGLIYAVLVSDGIPYHTASAWGSTFATIQGISQVGFIACFWLLFRKRFAKLASRASASGYWAKSGGQGGE